MSQPQGEERRPNLIQRSKDMLDTAVSGLKGRDMNALVDDFTREMTLVAEGLSEDLSLARQELSQLSASHTLLEEDRRKLEDRIGALQKRVDALEKQRDKVQQRKGLHAVLRQVTIIAAIVCGAWIVTALLKAFGG